MRSLLRPAVALGLTLSLLSSMFSLLNVAPAHAQSTTIEVTDVYNAVNAPDEWFQLYNMTKSSLTLTGWSVCTSNTCLALPTTTIESFSLAKFKASAFNNWPAGGLDGANDMLAIEDDSGKPTDSLNWGTPSSTWKNYATFKDMLWNPGIKAPDPTANQSFFRMAIGKDSDQPSDWLTTASRAVGAPPAANTATAVPAAPTTAPAAPTAAPTDVPTTAPAAPTTAPAAPTATAVPAALTGPNAPPNPKTGGEFPILLALGLIIGVLLVRFVRRGYSPAK